LEGFIRSIGASFEKGRLSVHPGLEDEPLPADAITDYSVALEIALRRRDNERNRLDRIEAKVAPIIAGTIAAFALFLDKANSWLDIGAATLYLIPLWQLFVAFRTYDYVDVPNLDNLKETWQRWPQTFLKAAFEGTVDAVSQNASMIDKKARQLNGAMNLVIAVTVIVLGLRIVEVSPLGVLFSENFRPRSVATTPPTSVDKSARPNPALGSSHHP
jgi:hypothetical protein